MKPLWLGKVHPNFLQTQTSVGHGSKFRRAPAGEESPVDFVVIAAQKDHARPTFQKAAKAFVVRIGQFMLVELLLAPGRMHIGWIRVEERGFCIRMIQVLFDELKGVLISDLRSK